MLIPYLHESVPSGVVVALYKGTRPGLLGVANRVGRYLDSGIYSHAELCIGGLSYSASFEDGGVRAKVVSYSSVGSWDFIVVPDPNNTIATNALKWFYAHMHEQYDVRGNIHFAFGFVKESSNKWFCSESIAAALGFQEPHRYGPSGLAVALHEKYGALLIQTQDRKCLTQ